MNSIRFLQPALFLAASLLVGCSADEGNGVRHEYSRTAIVPTAIVDAPELSRGNTLTGPIKGTAFQPNTDNIFAVTDYCTTASSPTSTSGFDYGVAYFHNEAVSSDASGRMDFNKPQYYPTVGKLYFYAYSPVMPDATAGIGYQKGSVGVAPTVTFDISGCVKDILWATDDSGIEWAGPGRTQTKQPTFKFEHKLQQLQFKFVRGADFPPGCKVSAIRIQGNPQSSDDDGNKLKDRVTLDLSDGKVTYFSSDKSVDNFTHELGSTNLWDIDSGESSGSYVFRPIQRLRLSFDVDMNPVNPKQSVRTYSADVTLASAQTDVGGKSYLITATFGGGIDVKISVEEKDGWHPCNLEKQKIDD